MNTFIEKYSGTEQRSPLGGLIRPAKRPADWVAPGPKPNTPQREDIWPGPGEDLCYLSGDFRILQLLSGHRWSVDDLVTAYSAVRVAEREPPKKTVDLGCGIGTVLLFVAWAFAEAQCHGIEAQSLSASMARRSLLWNGVDGRCEVRVGDLRDPALREGLFEVDLVTGTPPYLPPGTGLESKRAQCGPCRFEHLGGIEAYCLAASSMLRPGAPFVACSSAKQKNRVEQAAEQAGLSLEFFRDIVPKEGKEPLLSVFSMRKAARVQRMDLPPLVVRGHNNRFSDEYREVCQRMGIPLRP